MPIDANREHCGLTTARIGVCVSFDFRHGAESTRRRREHAGLEPISSPSAATSPASRAIRTRRVPFIRSRPGLVITVATVVVVAVGIAVTVSPIAHSLGFTTLPWQFYTALVVLTCTYLILVEITKKMFYADPIHPSGKARRTRGREHRIHRRAARFSYGG